MPTLSQSRAKLKRELLTELQDDYVGLWEVTRLVGDALGTSDAAVIQDITERVLFDMLMAGLIRPGLAKDDGSFEPWSLEPERAALRITKELREVGGTPRLGEIAWFDLTPRGERVAARPM